MKKLLGGIALFGVFALLLGAVNLNTTGPVSITAQEARVVHLFWHEAVGEPAAFAGLSASPRHS
jgi:hypothetical protein